MKLVPTTRRLATMLALALAGCSSDPRQTVEQDSQPAFIIDPAQPFHIEFGRGSGWHGLDTIKIDDTGSVILHRMKLTKHENENYQSWETATFKLGRASLVDVLKAIESNDLTALDKAYHADIADGTQWVLWIKQGDKEKSVYFNNSFPRPIVRFAEQLDAILKVAGSDKATWQPVSPFESRLHERDAWDSIER